MDITARLDWHPRLSDPTGARIRKPRQYGKTMVIDKGIGLHAFEDLLLTAGADEKFRLTGSCDQGDFRGDDPSFASNAQMIERYGGLRIVGRFPFVPGEPESKELADIACTCLDLSAVKAVLMKRNDEK